MTEPTAIPKKQIATIADQVKKTVMPQVENIAKKHAHLVRREMHSKLAQSAEADMSPEDAQEAMEIADGLLLSLDDPRRLYLPTFGVTRPINVEREPFGPRVDVIPELTTGSLTPVAGGHTGGMIAMTTTLVTSPAAFTSNAWTSLGSKFAFSGTGTAAPTALLVNSNPASCFCGPIYGTAGEVLLPISRLLSNGSYTAFYAGNDDYSSATTLNVQVVAENNCDVGEVEVSIYSFSSSAGDALTRVCTNAVTGPSNGAILGLTQSHPIVDGFAIAIRSTLERPLYGVEYKVTITKLSKFFTPTVCPQNLRAIKPSVVGNKDVNKAIKTGTILLNQSDQNTNLASGTTRTIRILDGWPAYSLLTEEDYYSAIMASRLKLTQFDYPKGVCLTHTNPSRKMLSTTSVPYGYGITLTVYSGCNFDVPEGTASVSFNGASHLAYHTQTSRGALMSTPPPRFIWVSNALEAIPSVSENPRHSEFLQKKRDGLRARVSGDKQKQLTGKQLMKNKVLTKDHAKKLASGLVDLGEFLI